MPDEGKITIKCNSCGKQFKAPAKLAGQKARCPCGQVLDVPPQMERGEENPPKGVWYYLKKGDREGPVTKEDLEEKIENGVIEVTDRVWKQGMESWKPAREVDELSFEASAADEEVEKEEGGEKPGAAMGEEKPEEEAEVSEEVTGEAEEKVEMGVEREAEKKVEKEVEEEEEGGESSEKKTEAKESGEAAGKPSRSPAKSRSKKGKRHTRSVRQADSEVPQLLIARVVSWGLIGTGGVCLLAGLVVSIMMLIQHGLAVPSVPVADLMLAGLAALFAGASLWIGRAAVQGLWKIARSLGDR